MSTLANDHLVALMRAEGVQPTRQDWIDLAYGQEAPEPWTAEHESEVPEELQDWSKVVIGDGP